MNICCNGCRMRESEIATIKDDGKVHIWTCGFRTDYLEKSHKQVLDAIGKYGKDNIIIEGCAPSIAPEVFDNFGAEIRPWKSQSYNGPLFLPKKENPVRYLDNYDCLLIQEGCPFSCSYCSEKFAFPPMRSFSFTEIIFHKVCKEIMLIGDCIGAWESDGRNFGWLIEHLSVDKIHLWNLHPVHALKFIESIMAIHKQGRLGHINIPIQSGSTNILAKMERHYSHLDEYIIFGRLEFSDYETHILIGFPSETAYDFNETLKLIERIKPTYILASRCMLNEQQIKELGKPADEITMNARCRALELLCERLGIICNIEGTEFAKGRC